MDEAVRLAREGVEKGEGGPFGAVVVHEGAIVGGSCNRVIGATDPTAHAEILAIRAAAQALGRYHLDGCELYATCEPCPMCLAAIHWARLDRVHYAQTRGNAAAAGFIDERLFAAMQNPEIELIHEHNAEAAKVFQEWQGPLY